MVNPFQNTTHYELVSMTERFLYVEEVFVINERIASSIVVGSGGQAKAIEGTCLFANVSFASPISTAPLL